MHYLDHAASTPLRPEALAVLQRAHELSGNPASLHRIGQAAKSQVETARAAVAASMAADSVEVVFTGSGTEAINEALKGLFWAAGPERNVIVVAEGEHHAVLDTVEWLEREQGAELAWVPLDHGGRIQMDAWTDALERNAGRVAVATAIWLNNETGMVQSVAELAAAAGRAGVPVHFDAVAAYGHEPIDVAALRTHASAGLAVSVSAHKIGGPQGIGALVIDRSLTPASLVHGGGQQRKLRAGTENVIGSVAFAAAADAMIESFDAERLQRARLRDRILNGLADLPDVRINGADEARGDAIVHATFAGCESDSLLFLLDQAGVEVSTGSACQAGVTEISHVVLALGYSEDEARGSLRFSLGHTSTDADVDALLAALPNALDRARDAGRSARSTRFDER